MSAFDEEPKEPTNQLSFLDDEEEEPKKETPTLEPQTKKSGAMNMDYSDEEIEAMLEEEAMKINGGVNESESRYRPEFLKQLKPIDLFAEDEQIEEGEQEDNDPMGWFAKPKDE